MKLLVFVFLAFFSYQSEALVEARIHYGVDVTKTKKFEADTLSRMHGLGADALVRLPMLPFGLGLRYTQLKNSVSESETLSFNTLAILANYRFIDTGLFLGAVGTFGISNSAKTKTKNPGSTESEQINSEIKLEETGSYSIGIEGGTHLTDKVSVGIELGYNFIEINDLEPSEIYAKAFIGMSF